jgi:hypothetical protein
VTAAKAAIARPVAKALRDKHLELVTKAAASAQAFIADRVAVANFEYTANDFLAMAGQPQVVRVAGATNDAADFASRAERLLTPPKQEAPRPAARPPLQPPDYSDLVAG